MKKIVSLFLWFCAATMIAQMCIIGLSIFKGNFTRQTAVQMIALLNGIDIQGQRLKGVLVSAKEVPTPTYEEVLNAKVQSSLELDSRAGALNRFEQQLKDLEKNLRSEIERFDARRAEFNRELERINKGSQSDGLNRLTKVFELLSPEQAKEQLLAMLKNGEKSDVVAIIKGMVPDKQKKIFGEFAPGEDQQRLAEILQELKNNKPLDALVEGAKKSAQP